MKPSLLFVPFLVLGAARSSAADDNASVSTQAATAVTWEAAIRCDGAVLDGHGEI